jgi:hypothetical protein
MARAREKGAAGDLQKASAPNDTNAGTIDGNWQWRLADFATARAGLRRLGGLAATYGRST